MSDVEAFFRCEYAGVADAQALVDGFGENILKFEPVVYDENAQPVFYIANGFVPAEVVDLLGAFVVTIEEEP